MEKVNNIRAMFYGTVCVIGGVLGNFLGGYDKLTKALIICMLLDYISGMILAAIFKKSSKTETGGLESNAGLKGLAKKIFILFIVAIAYQVDIILNSSFIRNAVILGFIANEILSLMENGGLMGIPMSPVLTNAIDILKKKSEESK